VDDAYTAADDAVDDTLEEEAPYCDNVPNDGGDTKDPAGGAVEKLGN
jgi:hypothetical protein